MLLARGIHVSTAVKYQEGAGVKSRSDALHHGAGKFRQISVFLPIPASCFLSPYLSLSFAYGQAETGLAYIIREFDSMPKHTLNSQYDVFTLLHTGKVLPFARECCSEPQR